MLNIKITPQDVIRATRMYGKDVPSIKGKTVNRPNTFARELLVPMSMQKEQQVHLDIFYWKGSTFVLAVMKPLNMNLVQWLPNHQNTSYYRPQSLA